MSSQSQNINYTVSMPEPVNHLFEIEMKIQTPRDAMGENIDFILPLWRSGRYVLFNFASGVQEFSAKGGSGENIKWHKTDKSTWQVEAGNEKSITIKYKMYANEFSNRTKGLNDEHAFIDPSALLMYVEKLRHENLSLRIIPYRNWHVTTGLDNVNGDNFLFSAVSYDYLADCPIMIGNQKDFDFNAGGKKHTISIFGEAKYNADSLIADLSKIIEVNKNFWGELPYERFVFMFQLTNQDYGGTEHMNSFEIDAPPNAFTDSSRYVGFLSTCSHEFFHTWNVKRLRPKGITPYDFTKENYSEEFWIAEGTTSYYQGLMLLKAGYKNEKRYIKNIENNIINDLTRPGNKIQTLAESSFDAWIKYWVNTPNKWNSESDYYSKGANVSLFLDLEIRNNSANKYSLDDVMRTMYQRFPLTAGGYTNADFIKICEEYAGENLSDFFNSYLYGLTPLDWNKYLSYAGLDLIITDTLKPYIGISTHDMNGKLYINNITYGSPAYESGLDAGDEISSANSKQVDAEKLMGLIMGLKEGDTLNIASIRDERKRDIELIVKNRKDLIIKIEKKEHPTGLQKTIYESWLNTKWG